MLSYLHVCWHSFLQRDYGSTYTQWKCLRGSLSQNDLRDSILCMMVSPVSALFSFTCAVTSFRFNIASTETSNSNYVGEKRENIWLRSYPPWDGFVLSGRATCSMMQLYLYTTQCATYWETHCATYWETHLRYRLVRYFYSCSDPFWSF